MNGRRRDVSLGVVVLGVRAGAAAGRLVVLPIRVLARGPLRPVVAQVEREAERAGSQARMRVRTRAERATAAALEAPEAERMLDVALARPIPDELAHRIVDRVLASPELDRVVEHVAASPAVRAAVVRQTSSFGDELAALVRGRCARLDDRLEGIVRRRPAVAQPYGGLATRSVAFAVDLALVAVAYLVAVAFAVLVVALVGEPSAWLAAGLLAAGWTLAAGAYFVLFWSAVGQTPGLHIMRQNVVGRRGAAPTVVQAIVRFVVMTLGVVTLLAGVLLILFDRRRRGLHDVVTRTVVRSTDAALP